MNSPCVTTALNSKSQERDFCTCLISHSPQDFQGLDTEERRDKVVATIRKVLSQLESGKQWKLGFASGTTVTQSRLRETANERWDLSGGPQKESFPKGWFAAAELLEMRQGVTPGGYLELFLLDQKKAVHLGLEDSLVHNAIKSKQLDRWRVEWKDRVLFYPYHARNGESEPAFTIPWDEIEDSSLKERLINLRVEDALDFNQQLDSWEIEIVKKSGINRESVPRMLKHRIALGLVKYPMSAAYLVSCYDKLEGRVFEKKKFTELGKRWYEYHRPRDVRLMLSKPRILSPTLLREVRFVLDEVGYLSDHACLILQPSSKTSRAWDEFVLEMKRVIGEAPSQKDLLGYCLAFMNSGYAQTRLVTGHRPTPKGSYAITEAFLKEIPIPKPTKKSSVKLIFKLVGELGQLKPGKSSEEEKLALEGKLNAVVEAQLTAMKA